MNIRVRVSTEYIDSIENLKGFEHRFQYHIKGTPANEREWGRIKHGDTIIIFELWPNQEEDDKTYEFICAIREDVNSKMIALDKRIKKLEQM